MRSLLDTPDSELVDAVHPSPNLEARAGTGRPSMLLMHYTGMASTKKAIQWLAAPESKVSCHYVVDEDGRITQMVAESARAWHAGKSFWAGDEDINSASIGIEIQNPGHEDGYDDFPPAQMAAVLALSQDIVARHAIPAERVLAHSDVAPSRKIDPGEKFDWAYLFQNGVGHWVAPEPVDPCDPGVGVGTESREVLEMQRLLARYGYAVSPTGVLDEGTDVAVRAFQLHFRPERVDNRIDRSSLLTLEKLIAALPAPLVA